MDNQKIYLLAELTVQPEFLNEVKGASSTRLQGKAGMTLQGTAAKSIWCRAEVAFFRA